MSPPCAPCEFELPWTDEPSPDAWSDEVQPESIRKAARNRAPAINNAILPMDIPVRQLARAMPAERAILRYKYVFRNNTQIAP